MVTFVNNANFESEVIKFHELVVLDFYSDWCRPCKMLAPIFEGLSNELKDVKFCKVNTDDNKELAEKFGVMGIPTLVFIKKGKELDRVVGLVDKDSLKERIKRLK